MDDQKDMQKNDRGFDTTDQPAEGGPYIEDRTSEKRAREQRKGAQNPDAIPVTGNTSGSATLDRAAPDTVEQFRSRWQNIQSNFMDDPHASIQQTEQLVEDMIESITRNVAARGDSPE
jgi:hypothetical protein